MEDFLLDGQTISTHLTKPSFSGHQTFPFRYTWLKKGVDAVIEDSTIFSSENASVTLGVGKNMVDSIRYWCRAARLIKVKGYQKRQFAPTTFGKAIFDDKKGFDPYLDDPATLWLIHWQIATNINLATAWYWAFNILKKNQFARKAFTEELHEWAQQQKKSMRPFSGNTLQRDVNCFIRTYCQSRHYADVVEETFDCPLVELDLITEVPEGGGYEFQRGEKDTLPIEVVTATLIVFWDARFSERDAVPFTEVMYAPLSPGRIFRLDEDSMTIYLEKLEQLTDGVIQYDETADVRQVYRRGNLNPLQLQLLKRYYG